MNPSEMEELIRQQEAHFVTYKDWSAIEPRVKTALAKVEEYDFELLADGPSERAVAHRLAVYLEQDFSGWHVDCEFNRQGEERKRGTKRVSTSGLLGRSRKDGWADVSPDIVIHKRRTAHNLLAIEVKLADSAGLARDREKLRKYLTEEHLRYAFAILVTYRNGGTSFEPLERITA